MSMRSSIAYDEASGAHICWHVGNQRFEFNADDEESESIVVAKALMLELLENADAIRAYAVRSVE